MKRQPWIECLSAARVKASAEASHTASSQSTQRDAAFAIATPCVGVKWSIWLHLQGRTAAYSHGARDAEWLERGVERLFRVLSERASGDELSASFSPVGTPASSPAGSGNGTAAKSSLRAFRRYACDLLTPSRWRARSVQRPSEQGSSFCGTTVQPLACVPKNGMMSHFADGSSE